MTLRLEGVLFDRHEHAWPAHITVIFGNLVLEDREVISPDLKVVLRRLKLSGMLDTLPERFATENASPGLATHRSAYLCENSDATTILNLNRVLEFRIHIPQLPSGPLFSN